MRYLSQKILYLLRKFKNEQLQVWGFKQFGDLGLGKNPNNIILLKQPIPRSDVLNDEPFRKNARLFQKVPYKNYIPMDILKYLCLGAL